MEDSDHPLGREASAHLLEEAEAGRRPIPAAELERLDRTTLLSFLTTRGIPPASWPASIEIPAVLKAELWVRAVASAKKGWAALAAQAIEDLAPGGERWDPALDVARAGIDAARARGGSPLDWQALASSSTYPELRPLVTQWARENVSRMRGDSEIAYLVLGDDPGGAALARANLPSPIASRMVTRMCDALQGPHGESARAWLEALATSALRDIVPLEIKLELPGAAGEPWMALARLRQAYNGVSPSSEAAPPEQHPFLDRELKSLAQAAPAGTPDLAALSAQLGGGLSESARRAVSKWIKPARPEEPGAPAKLLAGIAALAREQKGKLKAWPKPKQKPKAKLEPVPVPEPEPVPAEPPEPAVDESALTAMQSSLREWILGGSAADDRKADEQMIRLFEAGTADELRLARKAVASFGNGILYRLASRAAVNPRLMDGVARAVDSETLDTILQDAAQYDLWGFAPQAAERLHRSHREGSPGPLEEALVRLLRDGPSQVREALTQHLGKTDGALLEELLGRDGDGRLAS